MYMADNFLEYARESYENSITREINKPDDEAL